MANQAIGMLETRGMVGLVTAGDAMCKAANVSLTRTVEIGGGYVTTVVKVEEPILERRAADVRHEDLHERFRLRLSSPRPR